MLGGELQLMIMGGQDEYLHVDATAGFFDTQHISFQDFGLEAISVSDTPNTRRELEDPCSICCNSENEVTIGPCGHRLCYSCLNRIDICPYCRGELYPEEELYSDDEEEGEEYLTSNDDTLGLEILFLDEFDDPCVICYEEEKNIACKKCNNKICDDCHNKIDICPFCREPIQSPYEE